MAMTMTEFVTLSQADLDKIWHEEEVPFEAISTQVFNQVTQDDLYKLDAKLAGFGPSFDIPEGGDVQYDVAIAPITKRYELFKRGLGYKITDKFWKFDRYGEVKKFEADLRRADDDDTETFCFALLNNATATTTATGFDGLALASTAHTRLDGGTVLANRPSSLTALSLASLQDAVIAFTKFKNDRGRPFRSVPKTLLIPLDLVLVANEILGSEYVPNSANNAINAVRMFNIAPMTCPYITSTTYAALIGAKHDLNILWNQHTKVDMETDFESDTIKRKATKWLGRGFGEWRGYYHIQS